MLNFFIISSSRAAWASNQSTSGRTKQACQGYAAGTRPLPDGPEEMKPAGGDATAAENCMRFAGFGIINAHVASHVEVLVDRGSFGGSKISGVGEEFGMNMSITTIFMLDQ